MSTKRKRDSFDIETKFNIIKAVENKTPYNDILKQFN